MSHILVLPASPTSDPLHLGVRGTLDVRARYATVPISRLQLELWSNYAAIIQTLMRGDGHVCDLRLWADVTFHHEFPVRADHPSYTGARKAVVDRGEEWVLVAFARSRSRSTWEPRTSCSRGSTTTTAGCTSRPTSCRSRNSPTTCGARHERDHGTQDPQRPVRRSAAPPRRALRGPRARRALECVRSCSRRASSRGVHGRVHVREPGERPEPRSLALPDGVDEHGGRGRAHGLPRSRHLSGPASCCRPGLSLVHHGIATVEGGAPSTSSPARAREPCVGARARSRPGGDGPS